MKSRGIFLLGVTIVLLTGSCFAQEFPKWDLGLDYTYARWNPSNFPAGTISGTNQKFGNGHSLNGGGGTFTYNISGLLGIKGDLQGYGSTTSQFLIPVGNAVVPRGGAFRVSGNLFTYMLGPEVKLRAGRVQPYFQTLFGGAHSNVYKNLDSAICISQPIVGGGSTCTTNSTFRNPSSNAFAMVVGGGLDIPVNHRFTIRAAEIDYFLTRFGTTNFSVGNQNGLRAVTGVVFSF
jgi:hypothetical protein